MTPQEASALLAVAAAFDNRKPDPDAAQAWALALDGYRFEDCRDVIVAHYRTSRDWLMPSDVINGVKRLRADRLTAYGPIEPPADLDPDDTRAYAEWHADMRKRIGDGEITAPQPSEITGPARDVSTLGQIGRSVPNA